MRNLQLNVNYTTIFGIGKNVIKRYSANCVDINFTYIKNASYQKRTRYGKHERFFYHNFSWKEREEHSITNVLHEILIHDQTNIYQFKINLNIKIDPIPGT